MSYDGISKNDVGYAMHLAATHAKAYTGKHTHTRWESDGQEGGSVLHYTPGVSKCWQCKEVIDEKGNCDMEYWLAPKPFYGRGRECGGHG